MAVASPEQAPSRQRRPRRERRPFPWVKLGGFLAVLLVFGCIGAEILLRMADLKCGSTIMNTQKGVFQLDDGAGYTMRPNLCVRLHSDEYDELLLTNRRGLVGPDVPDTKAPGEFRVVVLGDSYTAGGQVPYEQNYTALLEQQLRAAGHPNVRVIDAGVGGWTTRNEAGYLASNLTWLKPDLVVVATFLGNDIGENILATRGGYRDAPEHPKGVTWSTEAADLLQASFDFFPRNHSGSKPPEDFVWESSKPIPTPPPNDPPPPPPDVAAARLHDAGIPPINADESLSAYRNRLTVLARSNVISAGPGGSNVDFAVQQATIQLVQQEATDRAQHVSPWDQARLSSRLLGRIFGEPDPDGAAATTAPGAAAVTAEQKRLNVSSGEWILLSDIPRQYWLDLAWPLYGAYLKEVRDTAASVGAPTVVLEIPVMAQFDDQMRAHTIADYRFVDGEVDWDRPQRDLLDQTNRLNVPVLDLLPAFRARSDRANLYLRIDTHFSALGHRVTAETLARFLLDQSLVH